MFQNLYVLIIWFFNYFQKQKIMKECTSIVRHFCHLDDSNKNQYLALDPQTFYSILRLNEIVVSNDY